MFYEQRSQCVSTNLWTNAKLWFRPAEGSLLAVHLRTPYRNYQRTIRNCAEGTNCALHIYELLMEVYHQQWILLCRIAWGKWGIFIHISTGCWNSKVALCYCRMTIRNAAEGTFSIRQTSIGLTVVDEQLVLLLCRRRFPLVNFWKSFFGRAENTARVLLLLKVWLSFLKLTWSSWRQLGLCCTPCTSY